MRLSGNNDLFVYSLYTNPLYSDIRLVGVLCHGTLLITQIANELARPNLLPSDNQPLLF